MTSNSTVLRTILSTNPPSSRSRYHNRSQPPHNTPRSDKLQSADDKCSMVSEEEVIFELDEAALSKLPTHLQNNMREIQAERFHRLQEEHKENFHNRFRVRRRDDLNNYEREVYAEKWYQNMLGKVAAARELEARTMNERDPGIARPEGMSWCPVRHGWVPKYASWGVSRGRSAMVGPADTCVAGLHDTTGFPRSCLPCAETAASGGYYVSSCNGRRESSCSSYMSWRCAGPYYVYEARAKEKFWERHTGLSSELRKRCMVFMSEICDRMGSKLLRAKKMLSR
ncbi:hypothetical protein BJY00DRAFT_43828 [Aspergillus carlsbadensis]|nr:hypothetical protein BJY00DRAFT_43828 [Aspergillus carlsbadensis]